MTHFIKQCEYGMTHGQCRCPAPNKKIIKVQCDIDSHAAEYAAKQQAQQADLQATIGSLLTEFRPPTIQEMQTAVYLVNRANGWHDEARPFAADIALLHSEVSEAYEGYRNHDTANVHEEMADVFIRLLDTCERHGIDLVAETVRKIKKNATRGYKHGNKAE